MPENKEGNIPNYYYPSMDKYGNYIIPFKSNNEAINVYKSTGLHNVIFGNYSPSGMAEQKSSTLKYSNPIINERNELILTPAQYYYAKKTPSFLDMVNRTGKFTDIIPLPNIPVNSIPVPPPIPLQIMKTPMAEGGIVGNGESGIIKGAGDSKSDSIISTEQNGTLIVPIEKVEEAKKIYKKHINKEIPIAKPDKNGTVVKLSNNEFKFTPEDLAILDKKGVNYSHLLPNHNNGFSGAEGAVVEDGDKTKILYDHFSKDYDLGSFDEFKNKLAIPEKRKAFYDGVSKEYDLGDYKAFEAKVMPLEKKKEQLQSISPFINSPSLQSGSKTSPYQPENLGGEIPSTSKTNFEQRIQTPVLNIPNPKDPSEKMTHQMMSFEDKGKYYAAPTIVEIDGKLKNFGQDKKGMNEAADYAIKTGEFKQFKTEKEAQDYAEGGYKKGTPLENYDKFISIHGKSEPYVWKPSEELDKVKKYSLPTVTTMTSGEGVISTVKEEAIKKEPTLPKWYSTMSSFNRALLSAPSDALKAIAITAKNTDWFNEYKGQKAEDLATYKLGQKMQDYIDKTFPVDDAYKEDLTTKLASNLGAIGSFIFGGETGEAMKMSKGATMAFMAASPNAVNEYQNALQKTKDPEKAWTAFKYNAAIGAMQALPITTTLNRINKLTDGSISKALAIGAHGAIDNTITMASANYLTNLTAKQIYDKQRELTQGMGETVEAAAIIGFVLPAFGVVVSNKLKNTSLPKDEKQTLEATLKENQQLIKTLPKDEDALIKSDVSNPKIDELKNKKNEIEKTVATHSDLSNETRQKLNEQVNDLNKTIHDDIQKHITEKADINLSEQKLSQTEDEINKLKEDSNKDIPIDVKSSINEEINNLQKEKENITNQLKSKENAIKERKIQQGSESEHKGTDTQRETASPSDSNRPVESKTIKEEVLKTNEDIIKESPPIKLDIDGDFKLQKTDEGYNVIEGVHGNIISEGATEKEAVDLANSKIKAKNYTFNDIVNISKKAIENLPTEPVKEITGKVIEPHKEVSASQAKAIDDVVKNFNHDLVPMEATMFFNELKDKDLPQYDWENGTKTFDVGEEGLKSKIFEKLDTKGYVSQMGDMGNYALTEKGQKFIEQVKARHETRKAVKAGLDLFPELANIPEFKTINKQIEDVKSELKERNKGKLHLNLPLENLDLYTKLAYLHIKKGVKTVAEFAKNVGQEISEVIQKAWDNATKQHEEENKPVTKEELDKKIEELEPKKKPLIETIKEFAKDNKVTESAKKIIKGFHPFWDIESRKTAMTIRKRSGEMKQALSKIAQSSEELRNKFAKNSWKENVAFILSIENPEKYGIAEGNLKKVADSYRERLDNVFNEISKIKDVPYTEDYFPHFWKDPEKAKTFFGEVYKKRPFEGGKSFLKQRFHEDILSGLKNGLELVSDNPEEITRMAEVNAWKFKMANNIFEDLKKDNLIQFVKSRSDAPEGWSLVNDPLFKRKSFIPKDLEKDYATMVEAGGGWYMPNDAAKIVDNYLSRGIYGKPIFDIARNFNNTLNQFQLGLSFFHGSTTTLEAAFTNQAIGINEILRGNISKGLKDLAGGVAFPKGVYDTYKLGKKVSKDYLDGITNDRVAALVKANANVQLDKFYRTNSFNNFKNSLSKRSWKAIPQFPFAMMDLVAKPIFEHYVPRLKVGSFIKLAESELANLKNPTEAEIDRTIQKTWDSIDNRLGQMSYDNIFWDKMVKDIGFLTVRSLGWTGGSIREIGGGIGDIPKSLSNVIKGKGISPRTAWLMSVIGGTAIYGGITNYLLTGTPPQSMEDYFHPRTGEINKDGSPSRISLPTYMKDIISYGTHSLRTLTNKTSPLLNDVISIYKNEDFYKRNIYNPEDPAYKRGEDILKYEAEQIIPFSYRNKKGEEKNILETIKSKFGTKEGLIQQFGLMPVAPESVEKRARYYELRDLFRKYKKARDVENMKIVMDKMAELLSEPEKLADKQNVVEDKSIKSKPVKSKRFTIMKNNK